MSNTDSRIVPRKISKLKGAFAMVALLLATGCASVGAPQQSRTLADFEQLSLQLDGSRAWRDGEAGRYQAVRIDPSMITFSPDIQLNDEQRMELRTALLAALTEKFQSAGLRASRPGDRIATLNVRGTVTAIDLASPALNVVTTIFLFAPLSRGSLTVELEAMDTESGRRVAALAFAGTAGVENITSAYSSTGHAKLQADLVAERFAQLVIGKSTVSAAVPEKARELR